MSALSQEALLYLTCLSSSRKISRSRKRLHLILNMYETCFFPFFLTHIENVFNYIYMHLLCISIIFFFSYFFLNICNRHTYNNLAYLHSSCHQMLGRSRLCMNSGRSLGCFHRSGHIACQDTASIHLHLSVWEKEPWESTQIPPVHSGLIQTHIHIYTSWTHYAHWS